MVASYPFYIQYAALGLHLSKIVVFCKRPISTGFGSARLIVFGSLFVAVEAVRFMAVRLYRYTLSLTYAATFFRQFGIDLGLTNLLTRYFHWYPTRPLWIITDFSARRRWLLLVNHCGYVTAAVGGLSGNPSIDGKNSCTRLI